MTGWRHASLGLVDRSRPISFRWEGRSYRGFRGDTLASALLANGVSIVGRSFKHHRPRGLLAAGLEEPSAIVQTGAGAKSLPNLRATEVDLVEGLEAHAVNAWPSVSTDVFASLGLMKRFIPAAFYYKTFMWPGWELFEPWIRRLAGLGHAPDQPDPDIYEHAHDHVDTLIIGAGVAGLQAALASIRSGVATLLIEHDAVAGGRALGAEQSLSGTPVGSWIAQALAEIDAAPHGRRLMRSTAIGLYDHGLAAIYEHSDPAGPPGDHGSLRGRLWKIRARRIIVAAGAIERPLVFSGNDCPGVMLASAAETYLHRYGVVSGRRIVLAANNDRAYRAAFALNDAGAEIVAVLDARPEADIGLLEIAHERFPVHSETLPLRVEGRDRVRAVRPARLDGSGAMASLSDEIACDTVLVSGGWTPSVHLHSHLGGRLRWDDMISSFVPVQPSDVLSVGEAAGEFADLGRIRPIVCVETPGGREEETAFVDLQNDVTLLDVRLAVRENFRSVEHLKRYTTLGMATDQGKTSNINGLAILAAELGRTPAEVGVTRFRPPYHPTPIGAFAGHRIGDTLRPRRRLAADAAHARMGARMEDYGHWSRPAFYPQARETEREAVHREACAVRTAAGLFDASSLGKIEVIGPDAGLFLDRIYPGSMAAMKPGRCKYAVMLSEHATILDDGVVARLDTNRFLVGATSGNAEKVAAHLEDWLQCEWPELRVMTTDVTMDWAVMTISGPKARLILAQLGASIDVSREAFPHLSVREGTLLGVPCRIQRVSFTGEVSFEISIPWAYAEDLHSRLMASRASLGLTPVGIEAIMTLRIEKGFIHLGSETDGVTLPDDLGLSGLVSRRKADFVGKRSLSRPEALRQDRRQLVGLETLDGSAPPIGAHVVSDRPDSLRGAAHSEGWVTSSILSPTLSRGIALGLVEAGRSRHGEIVILRDGNRVLKARITPPGAYDPSGERMHD
jgi:sarcosine oxidase subunit alpha